MKARQLTPDRKQRQAVGAYRQPASIKGALLCAARPSFSLTGAVSTRHGTAAHKRAPLPCPSAWALKPRHTQEQGCAVYGTWDCFLGAHKGAPTATESLARPRLPMPGHMKGHFFRCGTGKAGSGTVLDVVWSRSRKTARRLAHERTPWARPALSALSGRGAQAARLKCRRSGTSGQNPVDGLVLRCRCSAARHGVTACACSPAGTAPCWTASSRAWTILPTSS
jgi:hypothetical protein